MSDDRPVQYKLTGNADLSWIAFIVITATVVSTLLLGHLRSGVAVYRLGNDLAYATGEARALESERRNLEIELQHRHEAIDVWREAEAMGLAPPPPQRVIEVTE